VQVVSFPWLQYHPSSTPPRQNIRCSQQYITGQLHDLLGVADLD
jgi:hypothetical protein